MNNDELASQALSDEISFQLMQGDITQAPVDAIVNAANERLLHGGGVAALLVRSGGRVIQEESSAWVMEHGKVTHEKPAYTSAGSLPQRYIIHAVGPVWGSGEEDNKLEAAIKGSLDRADELKLQSIAFPAISTGIFGFPKERAARVTYQAVADYFANQTDSGIKNVQLIVYDQPTSDAFLDIWHMFFDKRIA